MAKVGYSEKDNGKPVVGVSPNTKIRPYVGCGAYEQAKVILQAIKDGTDVISLSAAWFNSILISLDKEKKEFLTGELYLKFALMAAEVNRVTFVSSVHNYAKPLIKKNAQGVIESEWIPASWAGRMDIGVGGAFGLLKGENIAVGAAQPANLQGDTAEIWLSQNPPFPGDPSKGEGSNFDVLKNTEVIYAPGENTSAGNGTSGAAAYIGAVVALMKSRNPALTPTEIKQILHSTATPISAQKLVNSERGRFFGMNFATVPFVNVRKAVEEAIRRKNPGNVNIVNQHLARDVMGVIDHPGNQNPTDSSPIYVKLNDGQRRPVVITSYGQYPNSNIAAMALKHGLVVKLKGWTGSEISTGRGMTLATAVEPLTVNSICDLDSGGIQNTCNPQQDALKPKLNQVLKLNQGGSKTNQLIRKVNFTIELASENLIGNYLKYGRLEDALKLVLRDNSLGNLSPLNTNKVTLSQDGRWVRFEDVALDVPSGGYKVLVRGATGDSNSIGPNLGSFSISAADTGAPPEGSIQVFSQNQVADWVEKDKQVDCPSSGCILGMTVLGNKENLKLKLQNQTVNVSGVNVPVLEIVDDFVAFSIPGDLPPEVYDIIIEIDGEQITLADVIQILAPPQPSPTPSPSASSGGSGGGSVTIPVKVSIANSGGNAGSPANSGVISALKSVKDSNGNNAQWVGFVNPGQPIQTDYAVPGLGSNKMWLRIDFQVVNSQKGGTVTVGLRSSVSQATFIGPEAEGTVKTFRFIEKADESGETIRFSLTNADANSQLIYVIRAE